MKKLVLAVVFLLASCASVEPKTPEQELAYTESQVAAVAEQAVEMRKNGNLSDEDYEKVLDLLQRANRALDSAWYLADQDENFEGYLNSLEEILTVAKEEME